MQSRRSESFGGILRNPTLMAMLGSVGFHGVLVLFSALHPADSQTNPLRIVSIAPQPVAPKGQPKGQGMGLPVPNSLPPINLGKVPELPASPDISALKIPPSQSLYMPSSGGIGKLRIANPPVRSFVPPSLVNPGVGNVSPGNTGVLSPPNVPTENNSASPSPFTPSSRTKFDYSKYAPSKNPDLPKVNQGEFQQNSEGLYARSSPPDSSGTPSGLGIVRVKLELRPGHGFRLRNSVTDKNLVCKLHNRSLQTIRSKPVPVNNKDWFGLQRYTVLMAH
jgi:hypothetical protein